MTNMNSIQNLLTIDESRGSICEQFHEMADGLLRHWCIRQGAVTFQFLEVEFYYFSLAHQDLRADGREMFVYERDCERAGVFLLHDSGVDICFKGRVENRADSCGGGLLIRTLLRIEGGEKNVVTGPWDCRDALFNYVDSQNFPRLEFVATPFEYERAIARRHNDNGSKKDEPYCVYNARFSKEMSMPWGYERFNPRMPSEAKSRYLSVPWEEKRAL